MHSPAAPQLQSRAQPVGRTREEKIAAFLRAVNFSFDRDRISPARCEYSLLLRRCYLGYREASRHDCSLQGEGRLSQGQAGWAL